MPKLGQHLEKHPETRNMIIEAVVAARARVAARKARSRTPRFARSQLLIGLVAVIATVVIARETVAAIVWLRDVDRASGTDQVPPSLRPDPTRPRVDAGKPALEPARHDEATSPVPKNTKDAPDGAPGHSAPGQLPAQKREPASRALQRRAPDEHAPGSASRQQLTAPTADIPLRALTIATAAGRGNPVDELTRDQVRRGVRDAVDLLRGCYEDQLLYTPTLQGDVRARFSIGVDGRVDDSTATGLGDAVNFCVARVIRRLVFSRGDSRVLVTYPFHFRLVPRPRGHRGVSPALEVGTPAVGRLRGQPGGT